MKTIELDDREYRLSIFQGPCSRCAVSSLACRSISEDCLSSWHFWRETLRSRWHRFVKAHLFDNAPEGHEDHAATRYAMEDSRFAQKAREASEVKLGPFDDTRLVPGTEPDGIERR